MKVVLKDGWFYEVRKQTWTLWGTMGVSPVDGHTYRLWGRRQTKAHAESDLCEWADANPELVERVEP
jgi:hypothetical protein